MNEPESLKNLTGMERLLQLTNILRERCPWDKKQTIESLRQLTIEETYEVSEAIMTGDQKSLKEELGDLLFHILFYAKIAEESNAFSFNEIVEGVTEKLIKRHPHVFGDLKITDEHEVKKNWEQWKLSEGRKSVLEGVPASLPPLIKAYRIQEKAKQVGFEWERAEQVFEKIEEEIEELKIEMNHQEPDLEKIEDELGDVLFSFINWSRFLGIDAETALEKTNQKFMQRFVAMEKLSNEQGKNIKDMNLQEMDMLWNEVKKRDRIS